MYAYCLLSNSVTSTIGFQARHPKYFSVIRTHNTVVYTVQGIHLLIRSKCIIMINGKKREENYHKRLKHIKQYKTAVCVCT
jgi:hypothetical protein